ncbi:MAG: tetratricopeptide repeat protein [Synechococcales cyanobacterium T60_A2020_003]|nr:tetratricopeptide repeat protein [Synechococcales cyanobacterium T60_A2020_003]
MCRKFGLCVSRGILLHDSDPSMPQLRQLALASAHDGDYECAITTFNHLLNLCPTSAVDYNNRGLVHFQAGHLDRAIADYNTALELDPYLDSAYNNRANYYAAKGDFLDAILDYNLALEINPDNIRAWINQGITFRDLRMYERALKNFNLALTFKQFEGRIYAERGRTHHLSGDWNWAIADYERACQLFAQDPHQPSGKRLKRQVERWINELLCNLKM